MGSSQVQDFEDKRWTEKEQKIVWRHKAALQLVSEEPVLDLGGGDGLFLTLLRERGFQQLKLLDISPVGVQKVKDKGFDAEVGDITRPLPFPDNAFGTACALDVLEHLYDPLSTLKEMARVSRWVVIVVPNFSFWKDRMQMLLGQVPFASKPKRGHVHWFNWTELRGITEQAGLRIDAALLGDIQRIGPAGKWLAKGRPNLFAHSLGVRLKKI
ncbi:MAG: class I SAM-dependent methyltransferase [Armatimonadetes bacterium]|nr:class I SAM-dependent methyltransferase [Armatimonadota bacterium]